MPDLGNLKLGEPQQKPTVKAASYASFLSQSGFQAATGGYTIQDPTMRQMVDQAKKTAKDFEKLGGKAGKAEDEIKAAPLLFLFPLGAIAGIAVGLAMPGGGAKKGILIGCCALLIASAGGQAAMGFPVEKDVKEQQKKDEAGAGGAKNAGLDGDILKTAYKFPFYLALLFAVGGIVTAAIEPAGTTGGKKKKRRRYDSDEDDEEPLSLEDDDQPEERPRSRSSDRDRDRDRGRRRDRDEQDERSDRGGKGRGRSREEDSDPDNPFKGLG